MRWDVCGLPPKAGAGFPLSEPVRGDWMVACWDGALWESGSGWRELGIERGSQTGAGGRRFCESGSFVSDRAPVGELGKYNEVCVRLGFSWVECSVMTSLAQAWSHSD